MIYCLVLKAQLFGFVIKHIFWGKMSFFRFFREKNLKPKKFVLGGKNEKIKRWILEENEKFHMRKYSYV
jgi:hypothetical protein